MMPNERIKINSLDKKAVTYLRVAATIFILLCHFLRMAPDPRISALSKLFNVGVQVFLILSGFLYGRRLIKEKTTYTAWIFERAKKIIIPMYITLTIILIGQLIFKAEINWSHYLAYVFNIQGLEIYVNGASHLWYLTIAMFCYLITPFLEHFSKYFFKKSFCIIFAVAFIVLQVVTTYFIYEQFGIYLILVLIYIAAYVIGLRWDSLKINFRTFLIAIAVCILSVGIRFSTRMFSDGTVFYNVMISGYTHLALAFGIFFAFFFLTNIIKDKEIPKIVKKFEGISYEIYLVHFMFIQGPYCLKLTGNTFFDSIIILIASIIAANILKQIEKPIFKLINKK